MFNTLASRVPADRDYPLRTHALEVRRRVLDGSLYDVLDHEFHDERSGAGEYVPLRHRRPSVRYNLCRLVVQDSIALLFGEGRFPAAQHPDKAAAEALAAIVAESKLGQAMLDAALRGSVGSIVVHLRVLKGRVFFDVLGTGFLTPEYDPEAPDTLVRVTERYKVRGDVLKAQGYSVPDDLLRADFWFQRVWDAQAETWFVPVPVRAAEEDAQPQPDPARTVRHGLGFVPMVWIRNLPGGAAPDGACTFDPAIETAIEIDYQLSQGGRGLKYSSDPLLLVKEPAAEDGSFVRSGANAMIVSEKGDAKMLEISGDASAAVIEYVRFLRELAIESIHGQRSSADRMGAAQSGRALELLHQPLIWLADQLRVSYGDNGILPLLRMIARVSQGGDLTAQGKRVPAIDPQGIALHWPRWFEPTAQDEQAQAAVLATLLGTGLLSRETGVKLAAAITKLAADDVPAELARILADLKAARDAANELPGAQSRVTEKVPA